MKSGIFDKNGIEVKKGDTLVFPYIDPMGSFMEDDPDFEAIVKFKHGCFGYDTPVYFVPLTEWSKTKPGEYVPNCGNKKLILDEYVFWVKPCKEG